MSTAPGGFEPYLNYDKLTDEMADDYRQKARHYREVSDALVGAEPDDPDLKAKTIAVMQAHEDISMCHQAIASSIFTVPMMVHVAGPVKEEHDEDDEPHEQHVQRCSRCGSVLNVWHEHMGVMTPEGPQALEYDDASWFPEGTRLGKADHGNHVHMVIIEPDRELEPYERECVALSELGLGD